MSCRACDYFEIWKGEGYCNYWRSNTNGSDTCQKDTSDRGSGHDEDDDYTNGSGCYITTIVCMILGFNDDSHMLETLRFFRENTLRPNKKYTHILEEYDSIGPFISSAIRDDPKSSALAFFTYKHYLVPVERLIKDGAIADAIDKYSQMVLMLKNRYMLS